MANLRKALADFVVSVDGEVDLEATFNAVKAAWVMECEASAVRDTEIESALDNAFACLGTDVYPTPEVVSIASTMLAGNDLTAMAGIADEVRDYLSRSSRFVGVRGRKGGLRRVSK